MQKHGCVYNNAVRREGITNLYAATAVDSVDVRSLLHVDWPTDCEMCHLVAGRAGEECARADGRELWVLGEMYEVAGMQEWLLKEGICRSTFGAAYEFGLVPEGVEREGLRDRCISVLEERGWALEEEGLRGVGRDAIEGLALARLRQVNDGRRLGWRCVRDGFRLLDAWMKANGGDDDVNWFRGIVTGLDYSGMPLKIFFDVVGGCDYVESAWASSIAEEKRALGGNIYQVEYKVERRYDMEELGVHALGIALDGQGAAQRMAVVDGGTNRVIIFNTETFHPLVAIGTEGNGPGQFQQLTEVAFSSTGELFACDRVRNLIQVFDRQGAYLRGFGTEGTEGGQFNAPHGLCFMADGNLVVADSHNHRVQILQPDGTFVRAIGSEGMGDGEFRSPTHVGVGHDGSIAVLDYGNRRVHLFDRDGQFLRIIGNPVHSREIVMGPDGLEGGQPKPGEFFNPTHVVVGVGGEIIVSDHNRDQLQVFSKEGDVLQIIGMLREDNFEGGKMPDEWKQDSRVKFRSPYSFATDSEGRIFICDDDVVLLS